jgi:hypothetical protein
MHMISILQNGLPILGTSPNSNPFDPLILRLLLQGYSDSKVFHMSKHVSIRSVREAVAALVDGSGPVRFESVSAARRGLSRTDGFDGWVPPPPVLKVWVVASRYPVVFDVRSGRDIGRSAVQRT